MTDLHTEVAPSQNLVSTMVGWPVHARRSSIAVTTVALILAAGCGAAPSPTPSTEAGTAAKDSPKKDKKDTPTEANGDAVALDKADESKKPPVNAEPPVNAAPPPGLVVGELSTPESAIHDEKADVYLVSNINGSPLDKDDNGFISRVTPTGEIAELKWIDGSKEEVTLHAPKGTAFLGDALVVADIDHIRFFDRTTGAPLQQIEIPGATFLNDVVASRDGASVFVTDTGMQMKDGEFAPSGTDAIYQVMADGRVEEVVKNPKLGGPNGITQAADGKLVVVNFRDGAIWTIDDMSVKPPATTRVVASDASPGQLDGIVALEGGDFLVSSWGTAKVHRLHDGKLSIALENVNAPADIGFDAQRGVLLVPLFMDGKLSVAAPSAASAN